MHKIEKRKILCYTSYKTLHIVVKYEFIIENFDFLSQRRYGVVCFHEIAEELKIYMAPSERGGIFAVQLIGDTLRAQMTKENSFGGIKTTYYDL